MRDLIAILGDERLAEQTAMIPWGAPIPVFGDVESSTVATLGLNPSDREFLDREGKELDGARRRFHTLGSLGLRGWSDTSRDQLELIAQACRGYFHTNPYDGWFRRLDTVIADTGASYYSRSSPACHLDLVPFATSRKWSELSSSQRTLLRNVSGPSLARLLRDSDIDTLVLNGRMVVDSFQELTETRLRRRRMESWTLPRNSGSGVCGVSYEGRVRVIGGLDLGRQIHVLGYNHNIQSSFGVTTSVVGAIQNWIGRRTRRFRDA